MKITVKQSDKIERLDKFILERLPKLSRSFIQKQIKNKNILINGEQTIARYKPTKGDAIEITKTEQDVPNISADKSVKFKIIEETDDYIIIDKPYGLIVHPADGIYEPTLVNGLLFKYPELIKVGEDELRPGIVHRLDKDVSGLMVIARTNKMFNHLKKQFQDRKITKEYTALVHGAIGEDGEINTPIGRSQTKGGKMAAHTSDYDSDREAKTEYKILKHVKKYTLLKVKIHTGRTHQIRVHLNSIEHPVVGDALYTNKRVQTRHASSLGRIFLHASKLGFDDLSGERRKYESLLPCELNEFLKKL